MRRALALAAIVVGGCWLATCGKGAQDQAAVRVGRHVITSGTIKHWTSLLLAAGDGGRESGPPLPVAPDYDTCIAYYAAHPPVALPQAASTRKQLKSFCAVQYRRFRLKAQYLLITYRWIVDQAAELGLSLDRAELQRDLAALRRALGLGSAASFQRYLHFRRADKADILLSFELEQLLRKIEAKVTASRGPGTATASGQAALARFGETFKRRWVARTDCEVGYVVPICRQYRPPKTPPELTPPSIPFANGP